MYKCVILALHLCSSLERSTATTVLCCGDFIQNYHLWFCMYKFWSGSEMQVRFISLIHFKSWLLYVNCINEVNWPAQLAGLHWKYIFFFEKLHIYDWNSFRIDQYVNWSILVQWICNIFKSTHKTFLSHNSPNKIAI